MRANRTLWMAMAVAWALAAPATGDSLVTLSGKRVEGQIIDETDRDVTIRTANYGDLKFRKIDLKELNKAGEGGGANPFGGASGLNPFSNVGFGTGFGVAEGESVAIPTPAPTLGPVGERAIVVPPAVPFSWDAVLFAIPEGRTVGVVAQPGAANEAAMSDTTLRSGAEIVTTDAPARVVFKNGQDIMRIAPHTSLALLESAPGVQSVDLRRGSIWLEVGRGTAPARTSVHTVNAELSTASGVFRVADALDLGFHVAAVEGNVLVRSSKAQAYATVGPGRMLLVRPDGALTEPQAVTRPVLLEDAQWDTMAADWWFKTERTDLPGRVDESQNTVSINELRPHIRRIGEGFLRLAEDTGHVPTTEEAFSVLRDNAAGLPNWKGPYLQGIIPPLDSWGRPLRYLTRQTSPAGNIVGIVYSTGEDNIDNNGDSSADVTEMILYYQIETLSAGQPGRRN